jgi:PAS domain S-box-containing protein
MRPNPKINIGAVDLSCAFVMCDILSEDQSIIYVSEAFERLTGYTKEEIIGRNCRFLQSPDGKISAGAKRTFVDGQTVHRLRSTIDDRSEIQASIINYRKGGQPFMNLITMIPIQWDSGEYRFYVGFQVDLVEKPDAVRRRNPGISQQKETESCSSLTFYRWYLQRELPTGPVTSIRGPARCFLITTGSHGAIWP